MSTITASDGTQFDPETCSLAIAYNGDGSVNYLECRYGNYTYRQTMTYANSQLVGVSGWVKQ